MKWAIIAAICISVFGFIPGMGLPGALVILAAEPPAAAVCALFGKTFNITTDYRAWGAAILMTWLWPVSIIPAFHIAFRKLSAKKKWLRFAAFFGILWLWAVLVAVGIQLTS